MKCQNCGKSQVNYHYSSNINGSVTETNLCSECAEKSGYDIGRLFDNGSVFDRYFPMTNRRGGLFSIDMPAIEYGLLAPFFATPARVRLGETGTCENGCDCATSETDTKSIKVDDEMNKRRELYIHMHEAAANEDFERAAEIRDKIKKLEN